MFYFRKSRLLFSFNSIKFAGTHLYTWVKRDTVRVKCLVQEHNTMSPASVKNSIELNRTQLNSIELEEFVNHSPAARDLQILLVFYQHPAWFISL